MLAEGTFQVPSRRVRRANPNPDPNPNPNPNPNTFQEGQEDAMITVGDTTPAGWKAVLAYLYTDTLSCDEGSVVDVMRKAQELGLDRLSALCLTYCRDHLAPSNAVGWLTQAEEHVLDRLKALTLMYVKREFRRIRMVAPQSLRLLANYPEVNLAVMMGI